jgi:hypothetical protein
MRPAFAREGHVQQRRFSAGGIVSLNRGGYSPLSDPSTAGPSSRY